MPHHRKKKMGKANNRTTVDFTEATKPIFDCLVRRYGSVKQVVSAAIVALNNLSADERERIMDHIAGNNPEELTLNKTSELLKMVKPCTRDYKIMIDFLRRRENRKQKKSKDASMSA